MTVGTRVAGQPKPKLPLEAGKMQCNACHDPHLRETDPSKGPAKFLRVNRFQEIAPNGGPFNEAADIVCLACHDKAGTTWALSAHAHPQVADELYSTTAAALREFPSNQPVWKGACLNCHDTHSVQGSRRLLREGTDSTATPKSGGNSAIEQTCYQCHSSLGDGSILTNVGSVPNIRTDFSLPRRMPITDADQGGDRGARHRHRHRHPARQGPGRSPHCCWARARRRTGMWNAPTATTRTASSRTASFNGQPRTCPTPPAPTTTAAGHTNLASGVLKGITGVEPVYAGAGLRQPTRWAFDFKRGDGGVGASTAATSTWVTREYQVCLKCHSNFAYDTPPALGSSGGGTPSGTNGLTQFTNQAMEFQAPTAHRGETTTTDSGAAAAFQTNNHRGWHPVIGPTGRTHAIRTTTTASFVAPFNGAADVGTQTMYCSDCHGSSTTGATVVPDGGENGNPWGPHGSTNNFILKGEWSGSTGASGRESQSANALCFKCHSANTYANRNGSGGTGFFNSDRGNLHAYHTDKIQRLHCTWCHVAVPHGWKNKALLVNLNDVGPEVGLPAGTQVKNNTTTPYNNPPYYLNAVLKVRTFAHQRQLGPEQLRLGGCARQRPEWPRLDARLQRELPERTMSALLRRIGSPAAGTPWLFGLLALAVVFSPCERAPAGHRGGGAAGAAGAAPGLGHGAAAAAAPRRAGAVPHLPAGLPGAAGLGAAHPFRRPGGTGRGHGLRRRGCHAHRAGPLARPARPWPRCSSRRAASR